MTGVSALGPWSGHKVLKAQGIAMGELTDAPEGVVGMPPMVHMPKRGPWAQTIARTAALLPGMPIELGTHGWKLADRPGADLEHARALLREDLDALAACADGWTGPLVLTVRGPWTLSSVLYLARGDRVLSDRGAVRDVVASLGEGIAELLGSMRTAVPGAQLTVVLREPLLPDVLGGAVPTFSGHSRLAAIERTDVSDGLRTVVAGSRAGGADQVVVHGGGRFASRSLKAMADAGADSVGVGLAAVQGAQWEQIAAIVESGTGLWLGLPRDTPRKGGPDIARLARAVHKPWTTLGLPASGLAEVVVHTDTSGTGDQVVTTLQDLRAEIEIAIKVATEIAARAAE